MAILVAGALACFASGAPPVAPVGFSGGTELDRRALESVVDELNQRVTALEHEDYRLRHAEGQPDSRTTWRGPFGQEASMSFSGRIHADLWTFPDDSPGVNAFESGDSTISPQDRLEIRRARFTTEGRLFKRTVYKLDIELAEASKPEFRDIYIGWTDVPLAQTLLFGNQKRPYGLDHLNNSNFNVFMERPFVVQAFNRNNRRFGLASHGVSEDEAWNWRFGVFNLRELQTDGQYISDHYQLEMAGRLARSIFDPRSPSRYAHLALSSSYAQPDGNPAPGREETQAWFRTRPEARSESTWLDTGIIHGADEFYVLGLESVVNLGRLQVTGEYLNLWLNRDPAFGDPVYFHGGYLYVACFLTDHYQPWDRGLGIIDRVAVLGQRRGQERDWCGAWQLACRWSFADLTDSDIAGGVGQSIAFGLNWYWTPRSRLQFNCVYGDVSNHFLVDGQTFGSYVTLGTRVMVDF